MRKFRFYSLLLLNFGAKPVSSVYQVIQFCSIVYNVMKLSAKNSIDIKKSLNKRTHSTNKFIKNNVLYRETRQTTFLLTKSHTLRMMPVKQRKADNFVNTKDSIGTIQKVSRDPHKKNKTIKIQFKNPNQQFLLKKSDKMKLVYWNKDPTLSELQKIVVSADYIVDQDNFWENCAEIDDERFIESVRNGNSGKVNPDWANVSLFKEWKQLHKCNFVIWTIRRKSSLVKIQQFVSFYGLALHAIFYIKRKKGYTVDYTPIQREIQKRQFAKNSEQFSQNIPFKMVESTPQELIIFQTIKVNLKDKLCYESYRGKVPVFLGGKGKVMFCRIENDPPGLQGIFKCLELPKKANPINTQSEINLKPYKLQSARRGNLQIYQLFPLRDYLTHSLLEKRKQDYELQMKGSSLDEDWEYDQQQIVQLIEQMKKKLIVELIEDNGRQYQFEGGNSIYNFVGQMFKRNYKILYELKLSEMGVAHRPKRRNEREEEQIDLELRVDYLQFEVK